MPSREFVLADEQPITVTRSKRSKNLRISIASDGRVRVSIPSWMPYRQGLEFAKQKSEWISANRHTAPLVITEGHIGKSYMISFLHAEEAKPRARVSGNDVIVKIPYGATIDSEDVQSTAQKACIRALKSEASTLLPIRLEVLAKRHGFEYRSLKIKHLTGRWGSCSSSKDITLNCLLMQLTWQEIDYVIMHELVHTKNMSHNKLFWDELGLLVNNMKEIKHKMKTRRPILQSN